MKIEILFFLYVITGIITISWLKRKQMRVALTAYGVLFGVLFGYLLFYSSSSLLNYCLSLFIDEQYLEYFSLPLLAPIWATLPFFNVLALATVLASIITVITLALVTVAVVRYIERSCGKKLKFYRYPTVKYIHENIIFDSGRRILLLFCRLNS